jgi:hypothetical protein
VKILSLALVSLTAFAGTARTQERGEAPLTVVEYTAALDAVRASLESDRLDEARAAADALRRRTVAWGGETLATDSSVLGAALAARDAAQARRAAVRVRRLVAALGAAPGPGQPTEAQAALLGRLVPGDDIQRGGDVGGLAVRPLSFPERVEAALLAAADAIASVLRRIRDWLGALRPRRLEEETPVPGRTALVAVAVALVLALVLVVLFLRTRRRGAAPAPGVESAPEVSSRRDEDPLSRESSGWEEHAARLAAARRWREAIRAWYHAVLVALFQAGLLHHQKGRTNWEYVARLDPRHAWRSGFVTLTRLFDREWYGRRASDAAALSECSREARSILAALRGTGRSV